MLARCEPPAPDAPRRRAIPWWLAGPLFVSGMFLLAYVCMGMVAVPPVLRLLLAIPGVGLVMLAWRNLRAPGLAALFWGGIFYAYAARVIHPGLMGAAGLAAAVGAVAYLVRIRKSPPSSP